MNFSQSVKTVLTTNYAKFSGRASRSEFWWFMLFYIVLKTLISITVPGASFTIGAITLFIRTIDRDLDGAAITRAALCVVINLALLLPLFSLMARRLHDRNLSGWWVLLYVVLSYVAGFAQGFALVFIPNLRHFITPVFNAIFAYIIWLALLAILFMPKGAQGPNQYGKDPRQSGSVADIFA